MYVIAAYFKLRLLFQNFQFVKVRSVKCLYKTRISTDN